MTSEQHFSKRRIAFMANTGYSLFHEEVQETYGGAQIDLFLLAKEFSTKPNYEVSMIFLDYGQPPVERIEGIQLYKSYPPRERGGLLVWQFATACYRLWGALRRANADVYFHEGAEFEIAVTRIFCFIKNRKYLLRFASISDVDGRYHKDNPIHSRLFSFGLSGASAIVAQTIDQATLLANIGKSVTIIENIFPYSPQLASVRKKIVWIGRLIKMKRAEIFLRLAKAFPQDHFVLLGPVEVIDKEYAKSIQLEARKIQNLEYIEKIPFCKVSEIFNHARLLVNTSEYEGFPMTFVQGMCHGVPILTMGVDPDHIVSEIAGFVAHDEQELHLRYSKIIQPDSWEQYSQDALDYAQEHFAPAVIIPKYIAILDSILSK